MSADPHAASVSVALISKGRPEILEETLRSLSHQTYRPKQIVIVVPSAEDLPKQHWNDDVQTVVGPLGITIQRNAALAAIPATVDYVAFFDDDFELSPDYLACAVAFMEANAGVVGISGRLLANGRIDREQARELIAKFKPERHFRGMFYSKGKDHILHGCNMVLRRGPLAYESFDEDLPLYSYEDYDLTMRLEHYGRIGRFSGCIGVHLETPTGRVREVQRSYSIVANNLHFIRKRTTHLSLPMAWLRFWIICVGKPLLAGAWNILKRDRSRDWLGQIKGTLLAVKDIVTGRCGPDRMKDL